MGKKSKARPIYILDTCSWMHQGIEPFLENLFKEDNFLFVPATVVKEVSYLLTSNAGQEDEKAKQVYLEANRAAFLMHKYKEQGKLETANIEGSEFDNRKFNDMFMFSFINRYREKNKIIFITQDINLAKAIVVLNELKFMEQERIYRVTVRMLTTKGKMVRFEFDTDPFCWKLLDPEIHKKAKESDEYMLETYGQTVKEIIADLNGSKGKKRKNTNQNSFQSGSDQNSWQNRTNYQNNYRNTYHNTFAESAGRYRKAQNGEWIPPEVRTEPRGYHLTDGTLLMQEKRIGGGGEGDVYQISGSNQLMKLYKSGHGYNDHTTYQKLLEMTNHELNHRGICFPIDIVYDRDNKFAGYTMDAAKGKSLKLTVMGEEKATRTFKGNFNKVDQIDICMQLLDMIDYIHGHDMLVGDISSNNILVDIDKNVYLIDTDSFQIGRKFRCKVGTPEYVPPELIGKDFSKIFRTEDNENFSIALLLFNILVGGAYPYSITDDDMTQNERTVKGIFPYYFSQTKGSKDAQPPNGRYRYIWSHLTSAIKNMFGETFSSDGNYFHDHRYSVSDWQEALDHYRFFLTTKNEKYAKGRDPMSLLAFPTQYKKIDEEYLDRGEYVKCKICGEDTLSTFTRLGLCPNCQNKRRWEKGDPDAPICRICKRPIYSYTYFQYYKREPFPDICSGCQRDIDSGLIDENGNKLY